MTHRFMLAITAFGFLVFPGSAGAQYDVPFVATPQEVVEEMLKIAEVGPDDFVIDLGSGDGRIVITAAKKFGARGLGVEIDPELYEKSKQAAQEAGVADRVGFIQADLFETDISKATVVTMYLLYTVNIRLRPRLLEELAPGTRVVSHDFSMGDWRPDQTLDAGPPGRERKVYFWVIPARVEGKWRMEVPAAFSPEPVALTLNQRFQQIEGFARIGDRELALAHPRLAGDRIFFELPLPEHGSFWRFEGQVSGEGMNGKVETEGHKTLAWKASRE